jgi:hypothetical protein
MTKYFHINLQFERLKCFHPSLIYPSEVRAHPSGAPYSATVRVYTLAHYKTSDKVGNDRNRHLKFVLDQMAKRFFNIGLIVLSLA